MKRVGDLSAGKHSIHSQQDFTIWVENCASENYFLCSVSLFSCHPTSLKGKS